MHGSSLYLKYILSMNLYPKFQIFVTKKPYVSCGSDSCTFIDFTGRLILIQMNAVYVDFLGGPGFKLSF